MPRALLATASLLLLAACGGESMDHVDASVASDGSTPADASTTDSSTPIDAGDLPICPSPSPMEGSACAPGDGCRIPGAPCSFVYRCVDGRWAPMTICPPIDAGS